MVDSSGWLEYFADGVNADIFAEPLQDIANVLVPAICYYEVFKVVLRERNESDALQVLALMHQGITIDLTPDIAVQAAKNSLQYRRLPRAIRTHQSHHFPLIYRNRRAIQRGGRE